MYIFIIIFFLHLKLYEINDLKLSRYVKEEQKGEEPKNLKHIFFLLYLCLNLQQAKVNFVV